MSRHARGRTRGIVLAVAIAALPGACVRAAAPPRDPPGERRAALARLVVENRTQAPIQIAFLYAAAPAGASGEVGVGTAAPGTRTEMAPVPAAEPIILIARGPGVERRLEPRTLEIDQLWTWVIDPDGTPGAGTGAP